MNNLEGNHLISSNLIEFVEDAIEKFSSEPENLIDKLKYRTSILLYNICSMYNTFMYHMGRLYQTLDKQKHELDRVKNDLRESKCTINLLKKQLLESQEEIKMLKYKLSS